MDTEQAQIANEFNKYFSNIIKQYAAKIKAAKSP